jgi:dihydrofolate synthase/folylpolyglutamate synthase
VTITPPLPAAEPDFPYYSVVDQIYHAEWTAEKLARQLLLQRSVAALWPAGHPTRLIHVAGTGGKGSTCRFLEAGLSVIGKAGAFMSPHLFDYRERFSIGGEFVSRADVTWAWEEVVRPHTVRLAAEQPHQAHSFHECSILIALALFDRYGVEWAALETGVGGCYDQTRGLSVAATLLTMPTCWATNAGSAPWTKRASPVPASPSSPPTASRRIWPSSARFARRPAHR